METSYLAGSMFNAADGALGSAVVAYILEGYFEFLVRFQTLHGEGVQPGASYEGYS